MGFIHSPKLVALVENTKETSTIEVRNFDVILVAGGQGPKFTYEKAADLHKKFVEFYEAGKIACVLCHGVSLLAFAKLTGGEYRQCRRGFRRQRRVEHEPSQPR